MNYSGVEGNEGRQIVHESTKSVGSLCGVCGTLHSQRPVVTKFQ